MKLNKEFINNFNKKYYLFGTFNIDGKEKSIPLYYGSLRSILKYTTYKTIKSKDSLLKILNYNLKKEKNVTLNAEQLISIFMSSNKNGKNKKEIKYCDSRDLLFCTSDDIYYNINEMMIKKEEFINPSEEKLAFAEFICNLIDEDYKRKLSEDRNSHIKTTPLDELRRIASRVISKNKLINISFSKLVLYDEDLLKTALYHICKDYDKKEVLINKVLELTDKNRILNERQLDNRSYVLSRKLKSNLESRKFIENEIYENLKKHNLVKTCFFEDENIDKKTKNEIHKNRIFDNPDYANYIKGIESPNYDDDDEYTIYDELNNYKSLRDKALDPQEKRELSMLVDATYKVIEYRNLLKRNEANYTEEQLRVLQITLAEYENRLDDLLNGNVRFGDGGLEIDDPNYGGK